MQRYESYKPSGVKWLGDVPAHWDIFPFKGLFRMSTEKNGKDVVGEMLSVSGYRGIEIKPYEFEEQKRTNTELRDYRVVHPGQLVVNTMWLNHTGLGVSEYEGHVSPAYRSYWFDPKLKARYVHYLMRSHSYVQGYTGQMQGVRPNSLQIKSCDFAKIPILVPSLDEQDRIVAFLDQKTDEIDAAITKKERSIELLNEQRSIQVNRAVTLGMDQSAPLRKGESEWIESVPEHWEIVPLKHISTVQSGVTLGKSYTSSKSTKSFPYLRVANVQDGYIDLSTVMEIVLPIQEAKNYLLRTGDILVTEGGDIDKLGRGNCWDGQIKDCLHQNHVFAVRVLKRVRPEFVALITGVSYARRYFTTTANKTTNLASTNKTKLGNLPVLVPPLSEQDAILYFCSSIKTRYEALISSVSREITALKKMKSSLVADAVTGRIKV